MNRIWNIIVRYTQCYDIEYYNFENTYSLLDDLDLSCISQMFNVKGISIKRSPDSAYKERSIPHREEKFQHIPAIFKHI